MSYAVNSVVAESNSQVPVQVAVDEFLLFWYPRPSKYS